MPHGNRAEAHLSYRSIGLELAKVATFTNGDLQVAESQQGQIADRSKVNGRNSAWSTVKTQKTAVKALTRGHSCDYSVYGSDPPLGDTYAIVILTLYTKEGEESLYILPYFIGSKAKCVHGQMAKSFVMRSSGQSSKRTVKIS